MLGGLLQTPGSFAEEALRPHELPGVGGEQTQPMVMSILRSDEGQTSTLLLSEESEEIVRRSAAIADEMGHPIIGTEHLLLALVEGDTEARRILNSHGLTAETIRARFES